MFTGIVQGKASVLEVVGSTKLKSVSIEFPQQSLLGLQTGASISINGTCLTVTKFNIIKSIAQFDVIQETLETTNLKMLEAGQLVNFERAAKIGDEIGGHLMSGHIQACVAVSRVIKTKENCSVFFTMPSLFEAYLIEKGFVGLNGCSLTIGIITNDEFCVHLIPETLLSTTFGQLREGELVNIEIDHQTQCIVDTVKRVLLEKKF